MVGLCGIVSESGSGRAAGAAARGWRRAQRLPAWASGMEIVGVPAILCKALPPTHPYLTAHGC